MENLNINKRLKKLQIPKFLEVSLGQTQSKNSFLKQVITALIEIFKNVNLDKNFSQLCCSKHQPISIYEFLNNNNANQFFESKIEGVGSLFALLIFFQCEDILILIEDDQTSICEAVLNNKTLNWNYLDTFNRLSQFTKLEFCKMVRFLIDMNWKVLMQTSKKLCAFNSTYKNMFTLNLFSNYSKIQFEKNIKSLLPNIHGFLESAGMKWIYTPSFNNDQEYETILSLNTFLHLTIIHHGKKHYIWKNKHEWKNLRICDLLHLFKDIDSFVPQEFPNLYFNKNYEHTLDQLLMYEVLVAKAQFIPEGLKLNIDMEEQPQEIYKHHNLAKQYRTVFSGLNIELLCNNPQCDVYKDNNMCILSIPINGNVYNIYEKCKEYKCVECQAPAEMKNFGFYNCHYALSFKHCLESKNEVKSISTGIMHADPNKTGFICWNIDTSKTFIVEKLLVQVWKDKLYHPKMICCVCLNSLDNEKNPKFCSKHPSHFLCRKQEKEYYVNNNCPDCDKDIKQWDWSPFIINDPRDENVYYTSDDEEEEEVEIEKEKEKNEPIIKGVIMNEIPANSIIIKSSN